MSNSFKKRKYGFFVHFVHGLSQFADGRKPQSFEEALLGFDVEGFADAIASMGVEYLILTAWHAKMLPLYPSAVTEKYRGIKMPARDLLGEIIDAITARGIDMLLYTHPRDGHDFSPEEKIAIGWGADIAGDKPDAASFDYDKWNAYVQALYSELLERYGKKLCGIYTDGTGPYSNKSAQYENTLQVVDYLKIRNIVKSANPELCLIQNHFGYLFSNDFEMPEGYFGFEEAHFGDTGVIPAANKALAICPFEGGWWPSSARAEKDARRSEVEQLARFVIFNASCTAGGGTCFASGPYCEGSLFPLGVAEYMQELGQLMRARAESVLEAVPSTSYPTYSGDTMSSRKYRCYTASADGKYEYLHLLGRPEGDSVQIPLAADGARLSAPVSLCSGLRILDFKCLEDGYILHLAGDFDAVDSVIRFARTGAKNPPATEWINDSDKRLRFEGTWKYVFLTEAPETHSALGSYESDYHVSGGAGAAVFTYFEGDRVKLYGNKRPGNGSASVYIDGVYSGEVTEDSEAVENRALLFSSIHLYGGTHTLYVVSNQNAPFELDAICICK